jgi:hypothetical protein
MALEGELRDFNILEVIQLLGQQGKTGVLRVWGWGKRADEAGIYFAEGRITHATSTQRTQGDLLGERLVKTGVIVRDDLFNVLRIQKKSGRFLGEIIVERGLADEQAVLNALYTQIHELIYEVFRLEAGKFEFRPIPLAEFPRLSVQLNADEVMLNILKMVDEWPEIEKRVPPPTMILQKTKTLEEHGITLSEDHDAVYQLVDGTRSVQEIVEVSLLGKFATLEILASLLEGGDIKEVSIKRAEAPVPMGPAFRVVQQRPPYVGYAVGLGISFVFLVISLLQFNPGFLWGSPRDGMSSTQGYIEKVRQERVEWGKEIFLLERGRYPDTLKELVDADILTEKDLKELDVRGKDNSP